MKRCLAALLLGLVAWAAWADRAGGPEVVGADRQILVLLRLPPAHHRLGDDYAGGYDDRGGRSARRRIAVGLAREHGLSLADDWPVPLLGVDCFVMNLPDDAAARRDELMRALAADPRVVWAQAMNVYRAQAHDDPLFAVQPAAARWHLDALHERVRGRGVRIAVIDSGVEASHPDLTGQLESSENFVAGRPFAAERHGTAVAGIIAARADNHLGIVGVAPEARLLALRACWEDGVAQTLCNSLGLARALSFAIEHQVEVINLSLSGPADRLLGGLLALAHERSIVVVAAADPALPGGGFPATAPGVLAVGDDGGLDAPAGVLLAPGRDVPTTRPPARWAVVSGPSYAAAHVTGLVALLSELGGRKALARGAESIAQFPGGAVDVCNTLRASADLCACPCALTTESALPARH